MVKLEKIKKTSFTNTLTTKREAIHFYLNIRLPLTELTVNVTNRLEVLMIHHEKRQLSNLTYSPVSRKKED